MSDALTFVINVKSDDAVTSVQKLKTTFAGLSSAFNSIKNIGLVQFSQSMQEMSDSIKGAVQPGVDFQQGMADLSAITGITGKDLETLGTAAREMGKKSGIGAGQAVEAFKLLASNIDISTIGGVEGLKKLQDATITLSQAAGTDLPMAANTMAGAMNQFKIPAADAARVINTLGAGAKWGAAEIPDLANSLQNAGAVAAGAGVSLESTVGALEILSQNMIKGAEAGTGLRNVILRLQTKEIPGIDLKAQGLSGSLAALQSRMNDAKFMADTFGVENIAVAQTLIKNAAEVENMTQKVTGTNVAYEQAAIRTNTYKHVLEQIKAKVDDFKIGIFSSTGAMLPWVEVIGQATAGISRVVPALSFMGDMMGTVAGSVGNLVKGLRSAKTAQEALNFAFMKTPWGAIFTAAVLLGGAIYALSGRTKELSAKQQILNEVKAKAAEYSARERMETDKLFDALKRTTPQSKERKDILAQMNEKYPELLKNMDLERAGTDQIAVAYRGVIAEIDKKARAKAAEDRLTELYKDQLTLKQAANEEFETNKKAAAEYSRNAKSVTTSYNPNAGAAITGMFLSKALQTSNVSQRALGANQMSINAIKSLMMADAPGMVTGGGNPKPLIPPVGGSAKDTAVSGLGGDSHAIKNIYINFESFIHENNNHIEQGKMTVTEMEGMLKQVFYRLLNDANHAGA